MTNQTRRTAQYESISEEEVREYLRANPDIFDRHPGLLEHLQLPHDAGVNTVSLIERQVSLLRERNRKLDHKLRDLIAVARTNDDLSKKIHRLALRLIAAADRAGALGIIEQTLRQDLGGDQATIVLFDSDDGETDLFEAPIVRRLDRGDGELAPFRSFLAGKKPRCGQIKGAKREFLFGTEGDQVHSAALIPLGERAARGFVAIGSRDAARFHPAMSTHFLARIGELIDQALCASGPD